MCNMYHDHFLSSFQTPSHQMGREKTPKLQKNKGSCKGKNEEWHQNGSKSHLRKLGDRMCVFCH